MHLIPTTYNTLLSATEEVLAGYLMLAVVAPVSTVLLEEMSAQSHEYEKKKILRLCQLAQQAIPHTLFSAGKVKVIPFETTGGASTTSASRNDPTLFGTTTLQSMAGMRYWLP